MKRVLVWPGLFVGGAVVALVTDMTLGLLWPGLEWRKPVADWLIGRGLPSVVAAYWSHVWIRLPDWAVLVSLGAVIGRMTRPGKRLRYALVMGCGFIAYSLVYTVPYCLRLSDYDLSLAMGTFWRSMAWNLTSLLLLLLATWLSSRTRSKPVVAAGRRPIAGS